MKNIKHILKQIKVSVIKIVPDARVFLYGSYARSDNRTDSDIDILILINKEIVTRDDEKKIKYPLYEIEFENGIIISPLIYSKKAWETKHKITPFYENVLRERKEL